MVLPVAPLLGKRHDMVQDIWEKMKGGWAAMGILDGFDEAKCLLLREQLNPMIAAGDAQYDQCREQVDIEEVVFDGTPFGSSSASLKLYVVTPKALADEERRKFVVWFFGGAFTFSSAEANKGRCAQMACDMCVVVVAPEVGVAPETKAPDTGLHGYASLRYMIQEAERFKLDTARAAIHGESSGGNVSMCVAMELAKRKEAGLVRFAASHIGAFNSDFLTEPDEDPAGDELKTDLHSACHKGHMSGMALSCTDSGRQFAEKDPDVFPAQMPEDLLSALPSVMLSTCEFDQFRRGNEMWAARLAAAGKLLEPVYILPGCGHGVYTPEAGAQRQTDEAALFARYL